MNSKPLILLVASLLCGPSLAAQVTTRRIASGLPGALWAGAPDGDERIFIATQGGQIRILVNGAILPTPFLDLTGDITSGGEQGLLGVAFHPNYATNGFFYVHYTDLGGDMVVARFRVSTSNRDVANEASESLVLFQADPFSNHNGGDLHFGPDGFLYVFFGDGGSANDPACNAQRLTTLLGKVLRLDVDSATPYAIPPSNPFVGTPGALGEIFHLGLRNPWRNGFDRVTGDLYIGDVGQGEREEIDVADAGTSGLNFGWKVMEGTRCNVSTSCPTGTPACNAPIYERPITELTHAGGSFAITGGRVYRGCAVPSEYGKYFFADFADDKIRSLVYNPSTGTISNLTDRTSQLAPGGGLSIQSIASFGEDGFGELLICDLSGGEVFKMVPTPAAQSASVVRNGSGTNRLCYLERSLPILGNVWEVRVDATGHPGAHTAFLMGHAAPATVPTPAGERLVNTSSTRYFFLSRPAGAGVVVFRSLLPCDASLAGLRLFTQAGLLGGGTELCNAIDLTAGWW